jgi:hypothetical protein
MVDGNAQVFRLIGVADLGDGIRYGVGDAHAVTPLPTRPAHARDFSLGGQFAETQTT